MFLVERGGGGGGRGDAGMHGYAKLTFNAHALQLDHVSFSTIGHMALQDTGL